MAKDDLKKRMLISITLVLVAELVAGFLVSKIGKFDLTPILLGVTLGGLCSYIKFFILIIGIDKAISKKLSKGYLMSINYLLRFFLTGLTLYIGAVSHSFNLWGTIAGVFSFQIATYSLK